MPSKKYFLTIIFANEKFLLANLPFLYFAAGNPPPHSIIDALFAHLETVDLFLARGECGSGYLYSINPYNSDEDNSSLINARMKENQYIDIIVIVDRKIMFKTQNIV
jgi:hypothetical protein